MLIFMSTRHLQPSTISRSLAVMFVGVVEGYS
jgi:hypothetical protein